MPPGPFVSRGKEKDIYSNRGGQHSSASLTKITFFLPQMFQGPEKHWEGRILFKKKHLYLVVFGQFKKSY